MSEFTDSVRTWFVKIFVKGNNLDIIPFQEKHTVVQNFDGKRGIPPSTSDVRTWYAGIQARYDEITSNGESLTADEKFLEASRKKKEAMVKELTELAELESLHLSMGDEGFREHCEEHGINPDEIISKFSMLQSTKKRADIIWDWLCKLLETGDPMSTTEIRKQAIQEGIIPASNKEWNTMRQMGSRKKLTRHQYGAGIWVLPKKYRPLVYR